MARTRSAARPPNLPTFDHYGWALRLVKRLRDGGTEADVVASAKSFAQDVRDIDCVYEATNLVGRSAQQIRKHCALPVAVVKRWKAAALNFGLGRGVTDRKLANFFSAMYKELHAAQIAEAVREAGNQAAKAKARHDKKKATQWRHVEANLAAMRRSITDGGCVPVPYPHE